jgi:hypothetical protein
MMTFNGKPFRAEDFSNALNRGVIESVRNQLRERLAEIRLPTTGEFPTVIVDGESLGELSIRVEGSPELLEHLKSRLSPEEQARTEFKVRHSVDNPRALLSYGGEDRVLAEAIAQGFMRNGIDTWWAEWELRAGDSLRQKIDEGLSNCTHFVVLLTPTSLTKPWVNQEMDAGLVRRLQQQCTFIPLRNDLPVSNLPPLLSGILSPEVTDDASNLDPVIHDIFGVTRKPALGIAPAVTRAPNTGYSAAAAAVAEVFVRSAEHAMIGEVQYHLTELVARTGLAEDDVTDALHELRSFFLEPGGTRQYLARGTLYATFDRYFMDFDPAQDALKLAADLVNDSNFPGDPKVIAERYGWVPRRLNPAVAYLMQRDAIRGREGLSTAPFGVGGIMSTDATRRFVKSRS